MTKNISIIPNLSANRAHRFIGSFLCKFSNHNGLYFLFYLNFGIMTFGNEDDCYD